MFDPSSMAKSPHLRNSDIDSVTRTREGMRLRMRSIELITAPSGLSITDDTGYHQVYSFRITFRLVIVITLGEPDEYDRRDQSAARSGTRMGRAYARAGVEE